MAELVQAQARRISASPLQIVALCLAVATLEGYDIQAIGVAGPKMIPALGLSPSAAGWVFSASMVGLIPGAAIGGWLADRIGRKPVLLGAILTFGLFSLLTMLASGYWTLFAVRVATGLGLGGGVPNLIAIAAEISPRRRRTLTTTIISAGMPTGGSVVSLVALAFPDISWQTIFLIGGALPIALAPLVVLRLPETGLRRRDGARAASVDVLDALFGEGRTPATLLLWTSFFLTLAVLYLLLNWLPILAVAKGLGKPAGSMAALAYNLGSLPGALVLGLAVDRLGLRWPMALAYAGLVAVMAGLAATATVTGMVLLAAGAGFLCVAGQYVLYAAASSYYPARVRGTGAGIAVAVGRLGSIAGPLVAGLLLQAGAQGNQILALAAPVAFGAGAATVLLTMLARPHSD